MKKQFRVNARLDEDTAAQLAFLRRVTRLGISALIKKSLAQLYEKARRDVERPYDILARVGFIGCAKGEGDLSQTYKQVLLEELEKKHGHR